MSHSQVWREIASDSLPAGRVIRRLHPELPHDVFIGENRPNERRFLALSLLGPVGDVPLIKRESKGVDVRVVLETPTKASIELSEATDRKTSLFEELVDDVVQLVASEPGDGVTARVVERLIAWQAFFASARRGLSTEEVAGLFAEAYVLRSGLMPELGALSAIRAWSGPFGGHQDFQTRTAALEVKSFRGTGPGRVRIASERQLEDAGVGDLFLAYIALDERQDGSGETLTDALTDLRRLCAGSIAALIELDDKLLTLGYHSSQGHLYNDRFVVRDSAWYSVEGEFPRLTSRDCPLGVGNVSYSLDLPAIAAWETSEEEVYKALRGSK